MNGVSELTTVPFASREEAKKDPLLQSLSNFIQLIIKDHSFTNLLYNEKFNKILTALPKYLVDSSCSVLDRKVNECFKWHSKWLDEPISQVNEQGLNKSEVEFRLIEALALEKCRELNELATFKWLEYVLLSKSLPIIELGWRLVSYFIPYSCLDAASIIQELIDINPTQSIRRFNQLCTLSTFDPQKDFLMEKLINLARAFIKMDDLDEESKSTLSYAMGRLIYELEDMKHEEAELLFKETCERKIEIHPYHPDVYFFTQKCKREISDSKNLEGLFQLAFKVLQHPDLSMEKESALGSANETNQEAQEFGEAMGRLLYELKEENPKNAALLFEETKKKEIRVITYQPDISYFNRKYKREGSSSKNYNKLYLLAIEILQNPDFTLENETGPVFTSSLNRLVQHMRGMKKDCSALIIAAALRQIKIANPKIQGCIDKWLRTKRRDQVKDLSEALDLLNGQNPADPDDWISFIHAADQCKNGKFKERAWRVFVEQIVKKQRLSFDKKGSANVWLAILESSLLPAEKIFFTFLNCQRQLDSLSSLFKVRELQELKNAFYCGLLDKIFKALKRDKLIFKDEDQICTCFDLIEESFHLVDPPFISQTLLSQIEDELLDVLRKHPRNQPLGPRALVKLLKLLDTFHLRKIANIDYLIWAFLLESLNNQMAHPLIFKYLIESIRAEGFSHSTFTLDLVDKVVLRATLAELDEFLNAVEALSGEINKKWIMPLILIQRFRHAKQMEEEGDSVKCFIENIILFNKHYELMGSMVHQVAQTATSVCFYMLLGRNSPDSFRCLYEILENLLIEKLEEQPEYLDFGISEPCVLELLEYMLRDKFSENVLIQKLSTNLLQAILPKLVRLGQPEKRMNALILSVLPRLIKDNGAHREDLNAIYNLLNSREGLFDKFFATFGIDEWSLILNKLLCHLFMRPFLGDNEYKELASISAMRRFVDPVFRRLVSLRTIEEKTIVTCLEYSLNILNELHYDAVFQQLFLMIYGEILTNCLFESYQEEHLFIQAMRKQLESLTMHPESFQDIFSYTCKSFNVLSKANSLIDKLKITMLEGLLLTMGKQTEVDEVNLSSIRESIQYGIQAKIYDQYPDEYWNHADHLSLYMPDRKPIEGEEGICEDFKTRFKGFSKLADLVSSELKNFQEARPRLIDRFCKLLAEKSKSREFSEEPEMPVIVIRMIRNACANTASLSERLNEAELLNNLLNTMGSSFDQELKQLPIESQAKAYRILNAAVSISSLAWQEFNLSDDLGKLFCTWKNNITMIGEGVDCPEKENLWLVLAKFFLNINVRKLGSPHQRCHYAEALAEIYKFCSPEKLGMGPVEFVGGNDNFDFLFDGLQDLKEKLFISLKSH